MIYLISYDLRKAGFDYKEFYSVLKSLGAKRVQSSLWKLITDETAQAVCNQLFTLMDKNDRLLVASFDPNQSFKMHNGATKLSQPL